jgi:hypothetical protein
MASIRPQVGMGASSSRPVVIEDESPHEFYANLLGIKPKPTSSTPGDSRRPTICTEQSFPIVPPEEAPQKDSVGDFFIRTYRRAVSNPPKLTALSLDQSNKGFKLLTRLGWNEDEGGLGKRRQGRLAPVMTCLKNDRYGIGAGKKKVAHVTHRPQQPAQAVTAKVTKAQRRRLREAEREQEQRREKRARMLLRTDVSDEYEKLYISLHGG